MTTTIQETIKRYILKICTVTAVTIISTTAVAITPNLEINADRDACEQWVDSVFNTLSERQQVAQLVFPKVVPTQGATSRTAIKRFIDTNGCGGLLFTSGTLEQYVEMSNYAQSVARVPVLMTFDGEWGLSMRITETPKFPCNMALGAITDTTLLYRYGLEMGRHCRLAGQHVDFAPVLDVNSNPRNPVIGYRSFGEDPHRVAALGTAFSRGLEDANVQAVGKHFPGHGDTSTDSHKESTIVNHNRAVLDSIDLVPFQDFIDNGLSGIMIGHIVVPALDPSGRPASLSHKMTTDLLRRDMGFEGLIYTDALGMKGAQLEGYNNAVEALRAGADVLLTSDHPLDDLNAIYALVQNGTIPRSIIEDRCKRILRYKYLLGLPHEKPADINGLKDRIDSPECRALINELCGASITVLWNKDNLLPIGELAGNSIAVVTIGTPGDDTFAETCAKYAHVDTYQTSGTIAASTLSKILSHDIVIAAVFSDSANARNAYGQLTGAKELVGVFMVTPYKMNKFAGALQKTDALVLAYDNITPMRPVAAQAVFGGIEIKGKLPVNIEPTGHLGQGLHIPQSRLGYTSPAAEGMATWITDTIDSIVNHAIAAGGFPGAQVFIARNGNIVYERAYGHLTTGGAPVTTSTLYDLASVSKTTGTLPGIMKLYDLGLLKTSDRASDYLPGLAGTNKTGITVEQLLYHESAMPPSLNMFNTMIDSTSYTGRLISPRRDEQHSIKIQNGAWGHNNGRLRTDITAVTRSDIFPNEAAKGIWVGTAAFDTIMGRIYNIPLRKSNAYCYSCLNFALLMDIEQHITGIPHDRFVTDSIWAPIGAYNACYRPTITHPLGCIAPTEQDNYLRRQLVHGYVHDETAAMLGGVSGNAGVFASAGDLAKLCQMWLNGGTYGDAQVLSQSTVDLFTKSKSPNSRRGLGFDKPDTSNPDNSPTCEEAGANVYGHLGFTGTVFWVDPDEDLIFIFLCNRVNPTRDNAAFNELNIRPELFRQVYRSLRTEND